MRDTLQRQLCGAQDFGTGTIPLEWFGKKPIMMAGGMQAIDTAFVTHETDGKVDGMSSVTFKTFEQRRERLQSEAVDLIWIDERPDEQIYSELLARTTATDGHLILSYTPIGEGAGGGHDVPIPERAVGRSRLFSASPVEVKHISDGTPRRTGRQLHRRRTRNPA